MGSDGHGVWQAVGQFHSEGWIEGERKKSSSVASTAIDTLQALRESAEKAAAAAAAVAKVTESLLAGVVAARGPAT